MGKASTAVEHSQLSLIADGEQAFRLRAATARLARRTLDVQYYIWDDDTTAKLLTYRLLEAARRGVRVRMLLDHANQLGRDVKWAALNSHPNIEVRLFNPFRGRYKHFLQWLYNVPQLNHRMHNKAWIMDGECALVGGRNIADHYFGVNAATNFRDLDLYARGPVVTDTLQAFDAYWHSDLAVPLKTYRPRTEQSAENIWQWLSQWRDTLQGYPYLFQQGEEFFAAMLAEENARSVSAPAVVLFDGPEKASGVRQTLMGAQLAALLGRRRHREVLIEASYFIPGQDFVAELGRLHADGSRVAVLTNSLATNDVVAAHAAYGRYRRALLAAGVELHELQPNARAMRRQSHLFKGRSRASLHTKAMVLDRREVFVGSFNMDPRSLHLNTEMGYYVVSEALGEQLAAFVEEGLAPDNSYRLEKGRGGLRWAAGGMQGKPVVLDREPRVSPWRRLLAMLLSVLPIERLL
ncbi:phospholipase D/transphosphatidylase [Alcanivorax hongdengensis A-11-3]|uniref:Phospholipase D/transphosphatidylase n=1 Tax=Alcanivorax hongdengensis A-11-3 TaxID=1177179 RepID=L0WC06_9GAMM|nr:phospholipase D family protein [Alcanivorax hongdengensis]EKF74519.1 phospholipase D/transphosphatidylase [Alcanivorax hongdengensis A-11-3]